MASVLEFARSVGFSPPLSGRALTGKFGVHSFRDAIAANAVQDLHRRTGGIFGPLGVPLSSLTKAADGSYGQGYQLGSIHLTDIGAVPTAVNNYEAEVTLSAVKCFGTQDADGSDSAYAVISVVSVDPNFNGSDKLALTTRTEIQDNVHAHDVIFKGSTLGIASAFPGSGISIHVGIWDHESGNADEIRDKINSVLEDAARKGASALAGAAAANDPTVSGGTVGDITDFEVGGVKPIQLLTVGIAGAIANAVSDDLVGEHTFLVPALNVVDLADQGKFSDSIRTSPDLDSDVQFNWPPRPEDEFLFSDGKGSYKIYFKIRGILKSQPVDPAVPAH